MAAPAKDTLKLVCHDCQRRGSRQLVGLAVREVRPDAPQFAPRDGGDEWYWWRPLQLRRWDRDAAMSAAAGSWADVTYRESESTERSLFLEVADGPTEGEMLLGHCRSVTCRRAIKIGQARLDERCARADGDTVAI